MIDDSLTGEESTSWLKSQLADQDLRLELFNSFTKEKNPDNRVRIKGLVHHAKDKKILLHVIPSAGRGTDFKLPGNAHVIVTFQPESYAELIQFIGRGARSFDANATWSLVLKNNEKIANLDEEQLINELKAMEDDVQHLNKL